MHGHFAQGKAIFKRGRMVTSLRAKQHSQAARNTSMQPDCRLSNYSRHATIHYRGIWTRIRLGIALFLHRSKEGTPFYGSCHRLPRLHSVSGFIACRASVSGLPLGLRFSTAACASCEQRHVLELPVSMFHNAKAFAGIAIYVCAAPWRIIRISRVYLERTIVKGLTNLIVHPSSLDNAKRTKQFEPSQPGPTLLIEAWIGLLDGFVNFICPIKFLIVSSAVNLFS